jgi:hypothetical protein
MTTAQFQSYHIERHAFMSVLTDYDCMYFAYYEGDAHVAKCPACGTNGAHYCPADIARS